jgi:methane monooxygenase PmoA-like
MLLRVHAGPHHRRFSPVFVDLDLDPKTRVTLFQEPGHRPRYAQLEATPAGSRLTWMIARLPAGQVQEYRLERTPRRRRPSPRVRWRELEAGGIQAMLEGQSAASWSLGNAAPCLDSLYIPTERSTSLVDRAWQSADLQPIPLTRSSVVQSDAAVPGPVFGRLTYRCHWLGAAEQRLAEELVRATVFATPAHLRLIDLEITLQATTGPITFALPSSTGLLNLQLAEPFTRASDFAITSSTGARSAEELALAPASWCLLDTPAVGLAVFARPQNAGGGCTWCFDPPATLRADPLSGLTRFAALVPEPRPQLAAGETAEFRFRLCVHAEKRRLTAIRQHFADFAFPPRVAIA